MLRAFQYSRYGDYFEIENIVVANLTECWTILICNLHCIVIVLPYVKIVVIRVFHVIIITLPKWKWTRDIDQIDEHHLKLVQNKSHQMFKFSLPLLNGMSLTQDRNCCSGYCSVIPLLIVIHYRYFLYLSRVVLFWLRTWSIVESTLIWNLHGLVGRIMLLVLCEFWNPLIWQPFEKDLCTSLLQNSKACLPWTRDVAMVIISENCTAGTGFWTPLIVDV